MPTPAEHYAQAEHLLTEAHELAIADADPAYMAAILAAAQVHATLATATDAARGATTLDYGADQ